MGIYIRRNTMGVKYTIIYVPIRGWASIFANTLWVTKYTINYRPIRKIHGSQLVMYIGPIWLAEYYATVLKYFQFLIDHVLLSFINTLVTIFEQ